MTTMRRLWFVGTALLLAGCESMERMSANNAAARVNVAALQSQAVVGAEWARTQAVASAAQAQAMSEVARTVAWSSQLPWVIGLVCLTVIVVAIIYWRGRIAEQSVGSGQPRITVLPPPARVLPPQRRAVEDFARAHGEQIAWTPEGKPLLQVDGQWRQLRITAK